MDEFSENTITQTNNITQANTIIQAMAMEGVKLNQMNFSGHWTLNDIVCQATSAFVDVTKLLVYNVQCTLNSTQIGSASNLLLSRKAAAARASN